MKRTKPIVIGHRGAMGHETENTLASIQKALDLKVDMIEIDVFKIASGEIVVFHDDTVDRLTNGKGPIEAYTFEALQQVTLIGNHHIPLLKQIIDLIDRKVPLNIELKGVDTAKEVDNILQEYIEKGWTFNDFLISSFNWEELKIIRQLNTHIAIAVLIENDSPLEALPLAKELHAVAINPDYQFVNQKIANQIKAMGFKIYPWTVNEPKDIIQMKRMGVDGMFTNYPERVN